MPRLYIIGKSVSLAPGATGEIKIEGLAEVAFSGRQILIASTGRFEITEIKDIAGFSYLKGVIRDDQLDKVRESGFLTGLLDIAPKDYRLFSLKDVSGATNLIYIALLGEIP